MARRATRKHSRKGLLGRVYSPIHHTLMAAKNIMGTGLNGIDSMGLSLTGHANAAVRNVFTRKGGRKASRKSRKASRKSRKASRKSRKASRKNRK
jgi:hypothetical protein